MVVLIFLAVTFTAIALTGRRSNLEEIGMSEYCKLECMCCK